MKRFLKVVVFCFLLALYYTNLTPVRAAFDSSPRQWYKCTDWELKGTTDNGWSTDTSFSKIKELNVGGQTQLLIGLTWTFQNFDYPTESLPAMVYESESPKIASVDSYGQIYGLSEGFTRIKVSCPQVNDKVSYMQIKVVDPNHIDVDDRPYDNSDEDEPYDWDEAGDFNNNNPDDEKQDEAETSELEAPYIKFKGNSLKSSVGEIITLVLTKDKNGMLDRQDKTSNNIQDYYDKIYFFSKNEAYAKVIGKRKLNGNIECSVQITGCDSNKKYTDCQIVAQILGTDREAVKTISIAANKAKVSLQSNEPISVYCGEETAIYTKIEETDFSYIPEITWDVSNSYVLDIEEFEGGCKIIPRTSGSAYVYLLADGKRVDKVKVKCIVKKPTFTVLSKTDLKLGKLKTVKVKVEGAEKNSSVYWNIEIIDYNSPYTYIESESYRLNKKGEATVKLNTESYFPDGFKSKKIKLVLTVKSYGKEFKKTITCKIKKK